MFTRHVSRQLAAQLDGQLAPLKARQVEMHLQQCADCRAEREQVQSGMALIKHLPVVAAPKAIWSSIDAAFEEAQRPTRALFPWRWAIAATLVLALAGAGTAYW